MVIKNINVLLSDDNTLLRKGLISLLSNEPDISVIGETTDGDATLEAVAFLRPQVAIVGLMLPLMGGVHTARRIRTRHESTEVLIISPFDDESQLRDALDAGVKGFLGKGSSFNHLLHAIRHAAAGDYYLSGIIGQDLVTKYLQPSSRDHKKAGVITMREKELALLLAKGHSTKEAAAMLKVSPKTAETHRASIMKKLRARNVTDIVRYCIRNRLIEP